MRQASCVKPEAQVPSEGSWFQSSCLPSLCAACRHSSRDWGGRGEAFSFSTSSQVQLEAADGPGSRPYCLRHSDRTTVETGFPHCWSASFGKWTCHSLRLFQEAAETCHVSTESFSLTQRATGFFFKKILSICWILQCAIWCTFFSNGCELMSKKEKGKKHLIYQPSVVFAWGALGLKEWVLLGHSALCVEPRGVAALPSCPRSDPQHGCTFFQSNQ